MDDMGKHSIANAYLERLMGFDWGLLQLTGQWEACV